MNKLFLTSSKRLIYDGEFKFIKVLLVDGEAVILPNHAPMIGELAKEGSIFFTTNKDKKIEIKNKGGFIIITKKMTKISITELEDL